MKNLRELTAARRAHTAAEIIVARMLGESWKDIAKRHRIHRITAMRMAQQHIDRVNCLENQHDCNIVLPQTTPQNRGDVGESAT